MGPYPGNETTFADAWEIANRVNTRAGGLRSFRRLHKELSKEDSLWIWNRTWDRAERTKYIERSHGNKVFKNEEFGCGEFDQKLRFTYQISFINEDGKEVQIYRHVNVDISRRVKDIRNEGAGKLDRIVRDDYFPGRHMNVMRNRITNFQLVNAVCITK